MVKALVIGTRAGLSYSLREQHKTYLEMFNDMKNVMTESSKLMTDASRSLHDTLKSENKESGKTLSSLKEVLGTAHELTKTLVEGKTTHGHLQVPSRPKRPKTSEPEPQPPVQPTGTKEEETKSTKELIQESMMKMKRDNFEAMVDCSSGDLAIKTKACGIDLRLVYNEEVRKWDIKKIYKKDVIPPELIPYINIFHNVTRTKSVAKKPAFFVMGWIIYDSVGELAPGMDPDEFWRKHLLF